MDGWMDGGRNNELVFRKKFRPIRSVGRSDGGVATRSRTKRVPNAAGKGREANETRSKYRARLRNGRRRRKTPSRVRYGVERGTRRVLLPQPFRRRRSTDLIFLKSFSSDRQKSGVDGLCAVDGVCRTRRLPATHPRRSEAPPRNSYVLVRQASPAATMAPNGLFYIQLTLTLPGTEP
jgi:hypothetical protein